MPERPRVLAFCMLYSSPEQGLHRGQRYRDRLRIEAMESRYNYEVFTCDLHDEKEGVDGRHMQANIDCNRFQRSMRSRWGNMPFDVCVLDYFGLPTSYAKARYGSGTFLKKNVVFLCSQRGVKDVWLPNIPSILELVEDAREVLEKNKLSIELVKEPERNPLYRATADVNREIKDSGEESKENDNQFSLLNAKFPFIRITSTPVHD